MQDAVRERHALEAAGRERGEVHAALGERDVGQAALGERRAGQPAAAHLDALGHRTCGAHVGEIGLVEREAGDTDALGARAGNLEADERWVFGQHPARMFAHAAGVPPGAVSA